MVNQTGKAQPPTAGKTVVFRLTRKGVLLWTVLICLISGWTFFLGILVGRDTAPIRFDIDRLQKELAELKKKSLDSALHRFKIKEDPNAEEPDLRFYEALRATAEELSLPPIPEGKKENTPASETVRTAKAPPPADPRGGGSGPSHPNPKDAGNRFSVQVASVKNAEDADRLVRTLVKKGFAAFRNAAEVPGKGTWYRVRVGPYGSREEAGGALKRLEKEKLKGFVTGY